MASSYKHQYYDNQTPYVNKIRRFIEIEQFDSYEYTLRCIKRSTCVAIEKIRRWSFYRDKTVMRISDILDSCRMIPYSTNWPVPDIQVLRRKFPEATNAPMLEFHHEMDKDYGLLDQRRPSSVRPKTKSPLPKANPPPPPPQSPLDQEAVEAVMALREHPSKYQRICDLIDQIVDEKTQKLRDELQKLRNENEALLARNRNEVDFLLESLEATTPIESPAGSV